MDDEGRVKPTMDQLHRWYWSASFAFNKGRDRPETMEMARAALSKVLRHAPTDSSLFSRASALLVKIDTGQNT